MQQVLHLSSLKFLSYTKLQKSLKAVENGVGCLVCQSDTFQQMSPFFLLKHNS